MTSQPTKPTMPWAAPAAAQPAGSRETLPGHCLPSGAPAPGRGAAGASPEEATRMLGDWSSSAARRGRRVGVAQPGEKAVGRPNPNHSVIL